MTGEDVLLGVAGGWCAPPDMLCACGGRIAKHVCTLTMVGGPPLDLPDAVAARGPGITGPCTPEHRCPKSMDPGGISWFDGCWCYRNPGVADDRIPLAPQNGEDGRG